MFKSNEANVYRQREDVLISAHGLQFASGQSEIQTVNFPLMSKITEAIRIFPDAIIQVSGHTDSIGDDGINRIISEARAIKVAKFLVELGGINPKNISAIGYGESRPVATNDTKQGRAENRRVEIKIINK
jgi:outer membrane protein OmpA-like peptidoglycan-associated protein